MLEIKDLKKNYGNTSVLKGINFTLDSGKFLAIVGPSGCGKTTLLKIIAGLVAPSSGSVVWQHTVVNSAQAITPVHKRNIGMVYQSLALWPHMRVYQQVSYPLESKRFNHWSKQQKEQQVIKTLTNCGLMIFKDRYPHELSGGQQQRVALARAIVAQPDILLMDEPLSALDAQLRIEMRHEIQRIHHLTKASVVYITHDQSEAMSMADYVIVMNEGKIEQIDTPQNLYLHPQTIFTAQFIGKYNMLAGTWQDNIFTIKNTTFQIKYPGIAAAFVSERVCPIRPDQFMVTSENQGLKCEVQSVQYHGMQYQYQMVFNDDIIDVFLGLDKQLQVGETVWIKPVI